MTPDQRKLVEDNIKLVPHTVWKYFRYAIEMGYEIDELISVGNLGLCKAALGFDESQGAFSTYAVRGICFSIRARLRDDARRYPVLRGTVDLYEPLSDQPGLTRADIAQPQNDMYFVGDMRQEYADKIAALPPNERSVMVMHLAGKTQTQMCKAMGWSQASCSRWLASARRKLKKNGVFTGGDVQ